MSIILKENARFSIEEKVAEYEVVLNEFIPDIPIKIYISKDFGKTLTGIGNMHFKEGDPEKFPGEYNGVIVGFGEDVESTVHDAIKSLLQSLQSEYPNGVPKDCYLYTEEFWGYEE